MAWGWEGVEKKAGEGQRVSIEREVDQLKEKERAKEERRTLRGKSHLRDHLHHGKHRFGGVVVEHRCFDFVPRDAHRRVARVIALAGNDLHRFFGRRGWLGFEEREQTAGDLLSAETTEEVANLVRIELVVQEEGRVGVVCARRRRTDRSSSGFVASLLCAPSARSPTDRKRWRMLTRIRIQSSTDPHQVRPDRVHSGAFDGLERIRDVAERLRHLLLTLKPMSVDEDLPGWWE